MTQEELKMVLYLSWSKETCSPGLKDEWTIENPSIGQCAVTALIVHDFYGGKIMRCMSSTGSHYYNLIDGKIVDFTVSQFNGEIPDYEHGEERSIEYLLSNTDTRDRYDKLLHNVGVEFLKFKQYKLIDGNGKEYTSITPGKFGGNKKLKIYGRLDCPSANSWLRKGFYKKYRVFFKTEEDAISAGYRPCAVCMPKEYAEWKSKNLVRTLKK